MFLWTDADVVEEHAAIISSVDMSRFRNRLVYREVSRRVVMKLKEKG
jgi:hypothetical protein